MRCSSNAAMVLMFNISKRSDAAKQEKGRRELTSEVTVTHWQLE